ncbi:hypothetical protein NCS57_00494900 [Fusarium keratoplasticum]|uniref:Uncharacterized protein n=1 Tax=Fusarium keratoplasticum TaxID=1328300 RepID=A0ACC0R854_9HYPO|nr:hypothetical protein NCS57_00494900 [Fusarium keratoplasticum]KAI8675922.1 hypothetical protein NCS57_00494900 [Fusarium keratoplasticum]
MIPSQRFLLAAAASVYVVLPATAQCPTSVRKINDGNVTFNATGDTSVTFVEKDPWHLSLTIEDSRRENTRYGSEWNTLQDLGVFLSVPESFIGTRDGNRTQVCTYRMEGQNATSDVEDNSAKLSCNGILSEDCQKALRSVSAPKDGECPSAPSSVAEACGESINIWTSVPLNFSSSNCSVDELPGVSLPDDYETFQLSGGGLVPPDAERDSFEVYDLRVQQPIPILLSVRLPDGKANAEVICLAPSNITQSSRKPEAEFPPNAAGSLEPRGAFVFAVAAVCVVGMVLAP